MDEKKNKTGTFSATLKFITSIIKLILLLVMLFIFIYFMFCMFF